MVYQHEGERIIIDSFSAREWDDFMIVTVDQPNISPEAYNQLSDAFTQASKQTKKQLIFMPKHVADTIEFYGVKEDDAS